MNRPLVITGILMAVLACSMAIVIIAGILTLMEAISTGMLSEFATGYALGVATPILVGLYIIMKLRRPHREISPFNSAMNSALESVESCF